MKYCNLIQWDYRSAGIPAKVWVKDLPLGDCRVSEGRCPRTIGDQFCFCPVICLFCVPTHSLTPNTPVESVLSAGLNICIRICICIMYNVYMCMLSKTAAESEVAKLKEPAL